MTATREDLDGQAAGSDAGGANVSDAALLLRLYRTAYRIRRCEQVLGQLFADNEVPGFIHLGIGQEGVAAGVIMALEPGDTIASNHRGHGHAIAKGMPLAGFFAEIMARDSGACRGRGGSMHVADMRQGMLGANGIVGAGLPIALGSAIAHQVRRTGNIAVAFFGDGAAAEGALHETLNMAKLWRVPLLLVCENNGWSEFSATGDVMATTTPLLAAAFGIACATVDGDDAVVVHAATHGFAAMLRGGDGPALLECCTHRVHGHFAGDAQKYRPQDDIARAKSADPVALLKCRLTAAGTAATVLAELEAAVDEGIATALAAARAGAAPDYAQALADVYTPATVRPA